MPPKKNWKLQFRLSRPDVSVGRKEGFGGEFRPTGYDPFDFAQGKLF